MPQYNITCHAMTSRKIKFESKLQRSEMGIFSYSRHASHAEIALKTD
jgi:hypothetical protein